jgi:conjugal transfer/type IV secretion protein DotA/TraY
MQGLLYILLLLISPEIFAGIFDPPPTDKSVSLLGTIFGSNIGTIYLGGVANPTVSSIMEKFNFIIVAVGTVVVSYVAILSVINTAQEGETMGKRWSGIWTPLRSVAGMCLMIPTPATGYSFIQIIVTYIIVQGIGAADQVWNLALDGLQRGASVALSTAKPPDPQDRLSRPAVNLTEDILAISICMEALSAISKTGDHVTMDDWLHRKAAYIKHYTTTPVQSPAEQAIPPAPPVTSVSFTGLSNFGVNDPTDTNTMHSATCGSINVVATAGLDSFPPGYFTDMSPQAQFKILTKTAQDLYDTKQLAISTMVTVLQPLAEGIVRGSIQPQIVSPTLNTLKMPKDTNVQLQPQGYKSAAQNAYISVLAGMIKPQDSTTVSQELRNAINTGRQKGWIVAGDYYFLFNRSVTPEYMPDIYNPPTGTEPLFCWSSCVAAMYGSPRTYTLAAKDNNTGLYTNPLLNHLGLSNDDVIALNTYLATGTIYLKNDADISRNLNLTNEGQGDIGNEIIAALAAPLKGLMHQLQANMTGVTAGGDPLLAQSRFGQDMMRSMEEAWLIIILVVAVMAIPSWIPFTAGPFGLYIGMLMSLITMVIPILALVWGIGATLAIYVPLIPFFIFTTATVGWLLAVIESVIAAPLIALGLVMPSNDELGKLEAALLILANVFLRPMLMVIGFIIAGRLYRGIIYIVDVGMLEVFNTINVETIFSSVLIMFIYCSFIMGVTNTCFSVIYGLPDKVMRWMGGGHAEQTDMSAMQQSKSSMQGATSAIGGSGQEMAGMAAKQVSEKAKSGAEAYANKKAEEKATKAEAQVGADAKAANKQMMEAEKARAENTKKAREMLDGFNAKDDKKAATDAVTPEKKSMLDSIKGAGGAKPSQAQAKADMAKVFGEMKTRQGRSGLDGGTEGKGGGSDLPGGGGGGKGGGTDLEP